ncbi:uncharacterized protein CLUP02_02449 [Colletotrichum lupini]|uniref:Uncharacterized protein n=1 Tax=Colletotrichum lupini TaxID=145971 RepID=A0A9Q8SH25_9PEZI|nr:uncharacterized protein CLUP02_02449 [Colletotrichum lupini]UQC76983.1 hypothetical protein CLUP02_02449 [Colletotrichum lupini]
MNRISQRPRGLSLSTHDFHCKPQWLHRIAGRQSHPLLLFADATSRSMAPGWHLVFRHFNLGYESDWQGRLRRGTVLRRSQPLWSPRVITYQIGLADAGMRSELAPEEPDTVLSRTESGAGRLVPRLFPPDDGHHLGILGILIEMTARTASSHGPLTFSVDLALIRLFDVSLVVEIGMRHGQQHEASCMSPTRKSEIPTTPTIPCLASWKHGASFGEADQIAFGTVHYKPLQTTSANFQTSGRGMSSSKITKEILVLLDWRFRAMETLPTDVLHSTDVKRPHQTVLRGPGAQAQLPYSVRALLSLSNYSRQTSPRTSAGISSSHVASFPSYRILADYVFYDIITRREMEIRSGRLPSSGNTEPSDYDLIWIPVYIRSHSCQLTLSARLPRCFILLPYSVIRPGGTDRTTLEGLEAACYKHITLLDW